MNQKFQEKDILRLYLLQKGFTLGYNNRYLHSESYIYEVNNNYSANWTEYILHGVDDFNDVYTSYDIGDNNSAFNSFQILMMDTVGPNFFNKPS